MSLELVALAVLMGAVTYPSRALPLLLPGIDHLPDSVHAYLRLVGPAILASLAAVNALLLVAPDGSSQLHVGVEALAVLVCVAVVPWRRNLLLGLLAAMALVGLARAAALTGQRWRRNGATSRPAGAP
jgi:branched-subunit amino acid transport protein